MRNRASNRTLKESADAFELNVQKQFCELLNAECDYHKEIEAIKKQLSSLPGYNAKEAFRVLDTQNIGFIDYFSIEDFLRNFGFKATKSDINSIIRRFDVTADARISFCEFIEGITPSNSKSTENVSRPHPTYNNVRGSPIHSSYQINKARIEDVRSSIDPDAQFSSPYRRSNTIDNYSKREDARDHVAYNKYQPREVIAPSHLNIRPEVFDKQQAKVPNYSNDFEKFQNERYRSGYDNKYQQPVEEYAQPRNNVCCDDPKCLKKFKLSSQYQRPLEGRRVDEREELPINYSKYRADPYEKPIEPFGNKIPSRDSFSSGLRPQINDPRENYRAKSFVEPNISPYRRNNIDRFEVPEDDRAFETDLRRNNYSTNGYVASAAPIVPNQKAQNTAKYSQYPGGYSSFNPDLRESIQNEPIAVNKSPYDRYNTRGFVVDSPSRLNRESAYNKPQYESPSRYNADNREVYNAQISPFRQSEKIYGAQTSSYRQLEQPPRAQVPSYHPSDRSYNTQVPPYRQSVKPNEFQAPSYKTIDQVYKSPTQRESFANRTPDRNLGEIDLIRERYTDYRGASTRSHSSYGNQRNYRQDPMKTSVLDPVGQGRDYRSKYSSNNYKADQMNIQSRPGSYYNNDRKQLDIGRPAHISTGDSRPMSQPKISTPKNAPISMANPNESADKVNVQTPKKTQAQSDKPMGAFNMVVSPEIVSKSGGGWSFIPSPETNKKDGDQSQKMKMMDGIQKGPLRL